MKLNLLLTILVVLAMVMVAALTLMAVIVTRAVIYHGEAAQIAGYPCAAEPLGSGEAQVQRALEIGGRKIGNGIDRCKQDLNLRAPRPVQYAHVILHRKQLETHPGGCSGLAMPGILS